MTDKIKHTRDQVPLEEEEEAEEAAAKSVDVEQNVAATSAPALENVHVKHAKSSLRIIEFV